MAGIISPWNFPLLLSLIDAVPALVAGCAALVKPSEATPRFVPVLRDIVAGVPGLAGVLQFVTGGGATGEALVRAADVVCFTGSMRTSPAWRNWRQKCSRPCTWNSAARTRPSSATTPTCRAAGVRWPGAALGSAWQRGRSVERCYVQRSVHDRFAELLTREVSALRHCWPDVGRGQLGPIIASVQEPIVRRHLADALQRGARAVTGGTVVEQGGGAWCQPTVLVDVTPDMAVMTEETFAAILPVMPFDSDDDAVRLANATEFGPSACAFSADLERARRIASQLQAGAVSINDAALTAMVHDAAK